MSEKERQDLINSLRIKGIKDESVLKAMMKVERHLFVPEAVKHHSYLDVALPIGYGQTISQPYTVAFMTCIVWEQKFIQLNGIMIFTIKLKN
jgi:protein-L-isoaspartate(D-aspartate) O-methyltransferase